jgi:hypothetical protein
MAPRFLENICIPGLLTFYELPIFMALLNLIRHYLLKIFFHDEVSNFMSLPVVLLKCGTFQINSQLLVYI